LIDGLDIEIGEECDASSDGCSEFSNDDEFPCDFFEFFPTNDIDLTNKEVDLTNKEVDLTNKEVDFTNKEVDLTTQEIFEILSIEHQSIKELKHKFIVLASYLRNSKIIISDLNKYSRKVLHSECETMNLYHWSTKIDNNKIIFMFQIEKKIK
jgi:hypothetical protein